MHQWPTVGVVGLGVDPERGRRLGMWMGIVPLLEGLAEKYPMAVLPPFGESEDRSSNRNAIARDPVEFERGRGVVIS
jgi:hypothetical protein